MPKIIYETSSYLVVKVLEADLEDLGLDVQVYLACLTFFEPAYTQIIQWAWMFYFRGSRRGAC